ncbi:MAG: hypothetical protein R3362_03185, partial [Rhodothermales bacterium]|nr:hypothetical protein [Rhodothermales bacterium]
MRTISTLLLLWILASTAALSQAPEEAGRPWYAHRYSPEEHGLHDQNWAVAQGPRDLLYAANRNGVLEFDGEEWRAIAIPNELARSMVARPDGTVFVGGVGEVGYLAPDPLGFTRYVSLLDAVPEEDRAFADVWTTHATSDGVFFQSFSHLLRWDGERMHLWRSDSRFHKAFTARDTVYVREEGVGLLRVDGDRLLPIAGGERFADERVDAVLPQGERRLLIAARGSGFWLWEDGHWAPFPTEADSYFRDHRLYHGALLRDGTYAFTTISGKVVLVDQAGRVRRALGEDVGLSPDDFILHAMQDRQGGLWLALNDGLLRVDAPTPLTVFDDDSGLEGTVYDVIRHRGRLYAATARGLFRLEPASTAAGLRGAPRFARVEEVGPQAWAALSTDDGLLVATSEGIVRLHEGGVERISEEKVFVLVHSDVHEGRIYAGMKEGLAVLERRGGAWVSTEVFHQEGADIRSVREGPGGEL